MMAATIINEFSIIICMTRNKLAINYKPVVIPYTKPGLDGDCYGDETNQL
jgi:hypothetical protein